MDTSPHEGTPTFSLAQWKQDKTITSLVCESGWLEKMIGFILWQWLPSPSERQELSAHLIGCQECRIAAIILLDTLQQTAFVTNRRMLRYIEKIVHFLQRLEQAATEEVAMKGTIASFVAHLQDEGIQQTTSKFAQFTLHLTRCQSCYDETMFLYQLYADEPEPDVVTVLAKVIADWEEMPPLSAENPSILSFPHGRPEEQKKSTPKHRTDRFG